jgi:hypothetical protein
MNQATLAIALVVAVVAQDGSYSTLNVIFSAFFDLISSFSTLI